MIGMCKVAINKETGEVSFDRDTMLSLASISCAYALKSVLGDDAKEKCEKAGINYDGIEELCSDIASCTCATLAGMLFETELAMPNICKELDIEMGGGNQEKYDEWKKEKNIKEFDGGVC